MEGIREGIERREVEWLSPRAALASQSRGRPNAEQPDELRTCFQRDRDRILHAKSFRRLKHKTQVFIAPTGDHFRTRLTHTLEVAQISRTVGRALRLNEDLIEAIALGHDVGHPPFGHAGEDALDSAIREVAPTEGGFRHYEQSLRMLMELEQLNLTHEVSDGIGGHSKGPADLSSSEAEKSPSQEAAVVRFCDRIAYLNHDYDDANRAGMIEAPNALFMELGSSQSQRIKAMVLDLVRESESTQEISMSEPMLKRMNELKDWMFENVYYGYTRAQPEINKAKALVRELFLYYAVGHHLPEGFVGVRGAIDYISGMTDRFALSEFERLRIPRGFGSV